MTSFSPHRRRIARFSRASSLLCVVLTPGAPLAAFLVALFAPVETLADMAGVSLLSPEAAETARLAFAIVALFSALPLSYGLIRLAACFRGFAEDALFAASTIAGLRDFAGAMLFWTLLQPVMMTVCGLILTLGQPEGSRQLALRLGSDTVLLGLFALCVLIVSWVLTEASALSEENEQFV